MTVDAIAGSLLLAARRDPGERLELVAPAGSAPARLLRLTATKLRFTVHDARAGAL